MTMRRLIEDFLPVTEISHECVREKLGGHRISRGHPRNIHLWWARRPLAAGRAAVYAALAPAPEPAELANLPKFFADLCHWDGLSRTESPALAAARKLIAEIAAKDGHRPVVLDPFGGGGAIPLEALRLGCDVISNDLNPVAHLIQRACLEWPQRWPDRFARLVEQWGAWVIDRAQEQVGGLYPDLPRARVPAYFGLTAGKSAKAEQTNWLANDAEDDDDGTITGAQSLDADKVRPIAYIWTRTVPSPAPGWQASEVPLVRQTWLRRKKSGFVALKPVVDRDKRTVTWAVLTSGRKTEAEAIADWGFDPAGLSARGTTACLFTGATVTADYVKQVGKATGLGQTLLAVVAVVPGRRGKVYLGSADVDLPVYDELLALATAEARGEECAGLGLPTENMPLNDSRWFSPPAIGLETWGSLFLPRQLATLATLCSLVRQVQPQVLAATADAELAAAVTGCLALLVGRIADRGSTLCHWHNIGEKTENTYARQALPMVWDFAEANPFGGASGDIRSQLRYIVEVLDHCAHAAANHPATVIRGGAQSLPLPTASVDAVVTDPPY